MAKVSVIVPVYNVEKYLKECLDSIINQTFSDIEIICVNDGSTDNSLNILNEYAQNDKRIKILNQTNQGLSAARNSGIKVANGEFLCFIDSDDWIDKNLIKDIYPLIKDNDADIAIYQFCNVYNNAIIDNNRLNDFAKNKSNILYFNDDKNIIYQSCTAVTKIYRKSFLLDNNLLFDANIRFSEDSIYWINLLYKNPKIVIMPKSYYFYRRRDNSITNQSFSLISKVYNTYNLFKNCQTYIELDDYDKLLVLDYYTRIALSCYSNMNSFKLYRHYEKDFMLFRQEYKFFERQDYLRFYGYRLMFFRHIYTLGKQFLILFNKALQIIKKRSV